MRSLDSITNSMNINLSNLQEIVGDRGAWHAHGITKSWTRLNDCTTRINLTDISKAKKEINDFAILDFKKNAIF